MEYGTMTKIGASADTDNDSLYFDGTEFVGRRSTEKIKSVRYNRVLTAATGTVAITGVGFQPSAIWATVKKNNTFVFSVGFIDGSREGGGNTYRASVFTGGIGNSTQASIGGGFTSSTAGQNGIINSYDSDGFTIGFTKVLSPAAGEYAINFICFR